MKFHVNDFNRCMNLFHASVISQLNAYDFWTILQEKADVAAKEAETAKAAWLCRVCLTAEVDITIVPCGHVLCRRCSSAVSRCPFCRLQVSKTMRIFRPWKWRCNYIYIYYIIYGKRRNSWLKISLAHGICQISAKIFFQSVHGGSSICYVHRRWIQNENIWRENMVIGILYIYIYF